MSKLNGDVIFLILQEFSNNSKLLYSCLLVNKIWCETAVPILWNNPYCQPNARKMLLNTILLHLSEESRENLKGQGIDFFIETHQQPLFNYISFWKHLDSGFFGDMIIENIGESKISVVSNEIMKLFNNGNTKFTHLHMN